MVEAPRAQVEASWLTAETQELPKHRARVPKTPAQPGDATGDAESGDAPEE
jgi:hypothetical protein